MFKTLIMLCINLTVSHSWAHSKNTKWRERKQRINNNDCNLLGTKKIVLQGVRNTWHFSGSEREAQFACAESFTVYFIFFLLQF